MGVGAEFYRAIAIQWFVDVTALALIASILGMVALKFFRPQRIALPSMLPGSREASPKSSELQESRPAIVKNIQETIESRKT
jgi:hypothetical protein